ncbi:MAG: RidA family protein, partial [Roseibium sp.]|uniref:RidA family protein n=1 Tax=Roseibium sp. TaxID=1936156 RepID=UPI00261F26BE
GYSQISIVDPHRLAFVSGQVAWRRDGGSVPGNIAEQTAIVIGNLREALVAIRAKPRDIVQMRLYVTDLGDEAQEIVMTQLAKFLDGTQPSLTGIGVNALAAPDLKIEMEMVVQVPA